MSKAIGIDLGTTSSYAAGLPVPLSLLFLLQVFSCVGVWRNGYGVEIIADDQGNRTSPSYVSFSDNKVFHCLFTRTERSASDRYFLVSGGDIVSGPAEDKEDRRVLPQQHCDRWQPTGELVST